MFRWSSEDMRGRRRKGVCDLAVGDWVMSRYRARWSGVVEALYPDGGLVDVRMVLDEHGVPVRKKKLFKCHCHWFTKIPPPQE